MNPLMDYQSLFGFENLEAAFDFALELNLSVIELKMIHHLSLRLEGLVTYLTTELFFCSLQGVIGLQVKIWGKLTWSLA